MATPLSSLKMRSNANRISDTPEDQPEMPRKHDTSVRPPKYMIRRRIPTTGKKFDATGLPTIAPMYGAAAKVAV
jgi:hypothetical protein